MPAEEITGGATRRFPYRYLLDLYGGGQLRIRRGDGAKEIGDAWRALEALRAMAAAASARTGHKAPPAAASRA